MFQITHVMLLSGPPQYKAETREHEGKLHAVDKLPAGFKLEPTYGDAFLTYKSDGTLHTVCSRYFFQRKGSRWLRWPFQDYITPAKAWREHQRTNP